MITQGLTICQSVLENNGCPQRLLPDYLLSAGVRKVLEDSYGLVKRRAFLRRHRYWSYGGIHSPTECQIWDREGIFPAEMPKGSVLPLTTKAFLFIKGHVESTTSYLSSLRAQNWFKCGSYLHEREKSAALKLPKCHDLLPHFQQDNKPAL